jgi:competence protein ComFC
MFKKILNFIFPKHCLSCNQKGNNLCNFCSSLIQANKTQHCYKCGKASLHGQTCEKHLYKKQENTLNGLLVSAHYNGNQILKKAIKTMKYKKIHEDISAQLASLAAKTLKPFLNSPPHSSLKSQSHSFIFILIPVPLHEERLKERGFNQAEILIKKVIQEISVKNSQLLTTHYKLLKRTKNTLQQASTKSRQDRFKNLKNAFQTSKKLNPDAIYILVDDVLTTGTTLEECCKTLKQAGARTVWGLVVGSNK